MTTYSIPDMTCGHCRAAVEAAMRDLDPSATVAVDLESRTAEIASAAPEDAVRAKLMQAGYPAQIAG
ncbi:heavy-metal-associated domain-containing protein [uncultured Limimaricola sp.]|uniref:heavy-metal-associated domain-containing protein n=1 Tax=uncultured Limimaricola sp. TaxID=2211667 RepID=UPI0030F73F59